MIASLFFMQWLSNIDVASILDTDFSCISTENCCLLNGELHKNDYLSIP